MLPFLTMEENRVESTSQAIGYQIQIVMTPVDFTFVMA
jgi:hypothetical protein